MPFYALPYHIGAWKGMAGHKKGNGYKLEEGHLLMQIIGGHENTQQKKPMQLYFQLVNAIVNIVLGKEAKKSRKSLFFDQLVGWSLGVHQKPNPKFKVK